MSRVLKILLLFLVLSLFPIKLVKADDKFCLEKEGFIYPLFGTSACSNPEDQLITKDEFINILDFEQGLRFSKLKEFRENKDDKKVKTEKDIKLVDVEKVKKESIKKIKINKIKQKRLAKIEKRKQEQENKKQERLAKIEKRKQEQEKKKQERLAKIETSSTQSEDTPLVVNQELKVILFNKKIVKNELVPSFTGNISILDKLDKKDFKQLLKTNSNLVLIIPKDFESFSNDISQNKMTSRVVTGIQQIPNPDYRRLEMEIRDKERKAMLAKREAELFEAKLYSQQSSGVGWLDVLSAVTNTGASIAYQNEYQNLQNELTNLVNSYSTTPMYLDKEIFSPYNYDVVNVKSEKKARFDVIRYIDKSFLKSDLELVEEKTFQVAYNIQSQDKRYNELINKYDTMERVKLWENKKLENLSIDNLLAKLENLKSTNLKNMNDVNSLLNYEPDKKSFWNKIFSFDKKKVKKRTASLSSKSSYETKDERFDSVVVVRTGSGMGSGFFISKDEILTNYHVIEGAMSISIIDKNKNRSSAVVIKKDLKRDLALLKTNMIGEPVSFYTGKLKQGEMVEALGHPKGKRWSLTKGWISAIRNESSTYNSTGSSNVLFIQTDAAINQGNSGGPLFFEDKVVGVNTQGLSKDATEGMNFAVHFSEVKEFLSQ